MALVGVERDLLFLEHGVELAHHERVELLLAQRRVVQLITQAGEEPFGGSPLQIRQWVDGDGSTSRVGLGLLTESSPHCRAPGGAFVGFTF